jgi:hypothetical protein
LRKEESRPTRLLFEKEEVSRWSPGRRSEQRAGATARLPADFSSVADPSVLPAWSGAAKLRKHWQHRIRVRVETHCDQVCDVRIVRTRTVRCGSAPVA